MTLGSCSGDRPASHPPIHPPGDRPGHVTVWRDACAGPRAVFDVGPARDPGRPTAAGAAAAWVLPDEVVGAEYRITAVRRRVEVRRAGVVVRVLELARHDGGWVPESVVACGAAIRVAADHPLHCRPGVVTAGGTRSPQLPVDPREELGIAQPIHLVRVLRCGVRLPGGRLLVLASDVWPVTAYTRSELGPEDVQLVSIALGRGREREYFPAEYAGVR